VKTLLAGQTYWRRFCYTAAGLLDSVEITGGGIAFRARRYLYNTVLGTLTEVHVGGAITRIGTQADLLPDTVTYPAGDKVIRRFTPLHSMTQLSSAAPYGGTIARSLQVDSLSRVTEQLVGDGTSGKRYLYDGLSRVISDADVVASSPPPPNCTGDPPPIIDEYGNNCVNTGGTTWQVVGSVQFAYDSVDNRTDKGGSYLVGNRIASFDGCSYTTDLDGNVTARTCGTQTVTFFWSAESRLDSLTVGSQRVAFKYDAGGRLIRIDVNGVAQSHFLWDGGNLLAELNGVGTAPVAEYSYFPGADNPHAVVVGGQEYHPQVDGLGNVIALTDNAQTVQRTYSYDAWGTLTGGTDTKPFSNVDRVRFKGALWLGPEVDLYYMRSRWYEPKSGRFLSEDPLGLAGGVNPYAFAGNDPVNGRDPTGLVLTLDGGGGGDRHCTARLVFEGNHL